MMSPLPGRFPDFLWHQWFQQVWAALRMIHIGTGDPEDVVTAPVGHLYLRLDGGENTTLYVKEANTDATGWVGK